MQDAYKGHTFDNKDTIIKFIFSLTINIYLNHICISVVLSIQPWLENRYIKVFHRTFVVYKKTLLCSLIQLMCSTILPWIEKNIRISHWLQFSKLHYQANQRGNSGFFLLLHVFRLTRSFCKCKAPLIKLCGFVNYMLVMKYLIEG